MNPMSVSPLRGASPRLVCRAVRQWCALFSEQRPDHARSCPSCRLYFQAVDALDNSLHHEAIASNRNAGAENSNLERDILRAVRSADPERRAPSRRPNGIWAAGLLSAAAATAVIALWPGARQPVDSTNRQANGLSAEDAAVIIRTVETLSTGLVESVIPAAGELVAENPLQRELSLVYSDMRSALDFLALNFLPDTRVEPAREPARRI